ncbi:MAG: HD domain-containing protein [Chloroflexi bacterium]|nr:HD domain-containing protein [Chloroflexota bacterium]
MLEDDLAQWVRERVKPKRYTHILGVRDYATRLAEIHGEPVRPLRIAALLHDAARDMPREQMLQQAEAWGIPIMPPQHAEPVLLHAELAVELARREWAIDDPAVLSAIRYHTSGHPDMTRSDMIFFLADGLEPTRDYPSVDLLRRIAERDVHRATRLLLANSIAYLRAGGKRIHPDTFDLQARLESEARSS